MKRKIVSLYIILTCCIMIACGGSAANSDEMIHETEIVRTERITMPNTSDFYEGTEWDVESLVKHFKELGFINIKTVAQSANKSHNIILSVSIKKGFSEEEWMAGEEFKHDREITIRYNDSPVLTVDNCHELKNVLYGPLDFAESIKENRC